MLMASSFRIAEGHCTPKSDQQRTRDLCLNKTLLRVKQKQRAKETTIMMVSVIYLPVAISIILFIFLKTQFKELFVKDGHCTSKQAGKKNYVL